MSNNLLQNTIENTQETIQNPIMSAYTVNTSAFQAVMEREFNAYLKNMSHLGLLTVSVKACKDAIATGVAVEVKAKKSTGRPKKAPARKVSDGDIIDDMVAKADSKPKKTRKPKLTDEEKAAKKAAKKLAAEQKKAEKAALKEKLKAEKLEAKRLEKEQKALEKAKIKAEKLAAKEAEKEAKKAAKAELKAQKKAEKKAAKMKDDERKKQEALALMTAAIEDSTNDVPITNAEGEVIGSKVEGFNFPDEKQSADELVEEESISGLPEGYKVFTHNSRPDEKLVIDETTKNVFKVDTQGDLDHIGQLAEDGTLLECEDSSDEDEDEFPEM